MNYLARRWLILDTMSWSSTTSPFSCFFHSTSPHIREVHSNLMIFPQPYFDFKNKHNVQIKQNEKLISTRKHKKNPDQREYVYYLYLHRSLFILLDNGWLHVALLCLGFPHLVHFWVGRCPPTDGVWLTCGLLTLVAIFGGRIT